jgi:hypothetical protein
LFYWLFLLGKPVALVKFGDYLLGWLLFFVLGVVTFLIFLLVGIGFAIYLIGWFI